MIGRIQFLVLLLLLAIPVFTFAQSGKVVGKVTDLETGEPLIGANIIIVSTSLGAATDENGDYIILNVPPGKYDIKARYIGYREQLIKGVNVSVNLTTETNFQLPTEEYTTQEVVVQAQRPLVSKNITNSTSVVKSEDIENLPVRGVNAVVALQAGVVSGAAAGGLNIRGSRNDGVAYYVDGVLVNNPVFGGSQTSTINNAIEEIQVQAGGYSAEFGGANGGIISTQTKSGGAKYKFSFEGITDNFATLGEKFLGTYSTHYSEYSVTFGGPIIPSYKKLRFFIAGSNTFSREGAAFYQGFDFENISDPTAGANPDTFTYQLPNHAVNGQSNTYQVQGNLTWDLNPFSVRFNMNYRRNESRSAVSAYNFPAQNSAPLNKNYTLTSSLKITQVLSKSAFYDLILNYFGDYYVTMDPIFEDNIVAYGDSILNAQVGRQLRGDGQNLVDIVGLGVSLRRGDAVISSYRKQRTNNLGGKINFLNQLGKHHEVKTGGEFSRYTIRRYSLPSPRTVALLSESIADGSRFDVYNRLDNYGYDVFGNKTDVDGLEAPKHPVFAAYYIQDKMEYSDLVLNIGFRLDYIDIDSKVFANPHNVQFTNTGEIDPTSLVDIDPILQVSPRLGFSFPVTDRTVFHAQYGKFIQQSRLRDVYQGYNVMADNIKGGFAISQPVGFGLRPERTTSYEIGFRQQIGDNFAFDITGFYKDLKDQVQIRQIYAEATANHSLYYAWVNGDFSTVKGIEIKLDMRRTERLAFTFDYTYSNALGTGSSPSTAFRTIWQSPTTTPNFPQQISPLDFNQTHRGFINLDYRWGNHDGGTILENFGFNILLGFNSGFNYTRWDGFGNARIPNEPLNESTTPWNFQIDLKVNKSFNIGPLNLDAYVWVINLLNTQNVTSVFPNTGDGYDDGFLTSEQGSSIVQGYTDVSPEVGQLYQDVYKANSYSTGNYGTPRQIRLGIRLNY